MNVKTKIQGLSLLSGGLLGLLFCSAVYAQSDQPVSELEPPPNVVEDTARKQNNESGLDVEERRYENRLDGVTVRHEDSSVVDYYDLSDPDIQRREGGIQEGGALRSWRLGVGKK